MLDVSRSMYRIDLLGKSRIYWGLNSIKHIVNKKHELDANDRYSLILFSDKSIELSKYVYTFKELYDYIYEEAELVGKTQFPLDRAIKSIIKEKRKIGQKIYRIIIISDGHIHPTVSNPIKFAKLAKDLGIICDVLRFGKAKITGNILQRVSEITGGHYYYVNDDEEFTKVIKLISEKKKIRVATIFDEGKEDSLDEMSKDIASPLLKIENLTEEQRQGINFEDLKCSICHSDRCMVCETGFYGCGRFCPNCLKPIHLHCAIKWSEAQQKGNNAESKDFKVLRCPFCYYLLKIPMMLKREVVSSQDSNDNVIKKIRFSDETSELMTSVCSHPDCGIMFDETMDTYVYKCEACGSYFHEDCLVKSHSRDKKCPYCKAISKRID
ncbi:MAG: VWA domain-containing protein [Promethearchaeota archaeon]|nr:MAG: VWA domain-containing protein [Candidatus Lokiarchaeota archaeon]